MRDLFDKVQKLAEGGDLYKKEEQSFEVDLLQGVVHKINGKKTVDVALRIVKDNNMGSAVATSIEDNSIIDRALTSCKYQKQTPVAFRNSTPSIVKCFDETLVNLTLDDMVGEGQRILQMFKAQAPEIVPDVHLKNVKRNIHIINSAGFDNSYDKTEYTLGLATKTAKGFMEVYQTLEGASFGQLSEQDIAAMIFKHKISQNRVGIETGKLPVIFSGKAMGSLMMRFLAGVKASNVLKSLSPLEGKLGEEIFAKGVTIRDNALLDWGMGSCAFDDEGIAATDSLLVQDGVLKGYLVSCSDAEKLQLEPTGNSFKRTLFTQDIEDAPALDSTNLMIEGVNLPDEELIRGIQKGIYVDSVMGAHTGNIIAGEYSLNIGCGYLIENGQFTGKVMDAMIAGNIYKDFKNIVALGTKLEPMRTIFYSIGYSPMTLFSELSIVGKK